MLVNNAGINIKKKDFIAVTDEEFQAVLTTNVTAMPFAMNDRE
jgi:NAD(P)-dependent dehydrogenase (short-subunit alcohol dehydrogenase family)